MAEQYSEIPRQARDDRLVEAIDLNRHGGSVNRLYRFGM